MKGDFKPSSMKLGNVKEINFLSTILPFFLDFIFFLSWMLKIMGLKFGLHN